MKLFYTPFYFTKATLQYTKYSLIVRYILRVIIELNEYMSLMQKNKSIIKLTISLTSV